MESDLSVAPAVPSAAPDAASGWPRQGARQRRASLGKHRTPTIASARLALRAASTALAVTLLCLPRARAEDFTVGSEAELRAALATIFAVADLNANNTITFTVEEIPLTSQLVIGKTATTWDWEQVTLVPGSSGKLTFTAGTEAAPVDYAPILVMSPLLVDGDLGLDIHSTDRAVHIEFINGNSRADWDLFRIDGELSGTVVAGAAAIHRYSHMGRESTYFIERIGPGTVLSTTSGRLEPANYQKARAGIFSLANRNVLHIGTLEGTVSVFNGDGADPMRDVDAVAVANFRRLDEGEGGAIQIDRITATGQIIAESMVEEPYSDAIGVLGYQGVTIDDMGGLIRARSPLNYSVGVLASEGAIDLTLSGTGRIEAECCQGMVFPEPVPPDLLPNYAIRSAIYREGAILPWTIPNIRLDWADSVELTGSSALVGRVDLAYGTDTFTLSGHADITGVPILDGGEYISRGEAESEPIVIPDPDGGDDIIIEMDFADKLILNGWGTDAQPGSFGGVLLRGWEKMTVAGNSVVHLGESRTFEASTSVLFGDPADVYPELEMIVEAGSKILAYGNSSAHYTFVGDYANGGLLDLRDDSALPADTDDRVTVTGTYTGTGAAARLGLDVRMADGSQDDPALLDLLVVENAAGRTAIVIRNVSAGDVIAVTGPGSGILLVKVNANSTADAFVLAADNAFGTATVQLARIDDEGDADPANDDWVLQVLSGGTGGTPDGGGGGGDTTPPDLPSGIEPVPVSGAVLAMLGRDLLPRFHERQAYGWQSGRDAGAWWTLTRGFQTEGELEVGGIRSTWDGRGETLQLGRDLYHLDDGAQTVRAGLYAGIGRASTTIRDAAGQGAGSLDVNSLTFGGYASVEADAGWYAEGVVSATRHAVRAGFATGTTDRDSVWAYAASAEGGLSLRPHPWVVLEPQMQLTWQGQDAYRLEAPDGVAQVDERSGLVGRIGITGSYERPDWGMVPFFEANLHHDFGQDDQVRFATVADGQSVDRGRTLLGGSIGVASRSDADDLEYYAKVSATTDLDGYRSRNYALALGLRLTF